MHEMNADKKQYLSVIYNSIVPFLYTFGYKMTRSTELIEDSIQDVFLRLCEKEDLSGIRDMKAYLLRVMKHSLLEKLARAPLENIDDTSQTMLLERSPVLCNGTPAAHPCSSPFSTHSLTIRYSSSCC